MLSWHSIEGTEENFKNLFRIAGVMPGIKHEMSRMTADVLACISTANHHYY